MLSLINKFISMPHVLRCIRVRQHVEQAVICVTLLHIDE
jgi:hypothetical protein